jgi:hypothetical protein
MKNVLSAMLQSSTNMLMANEHISQYYLKND